MNPAIVKMTAERIAALEAEVAALKRLNSGLEAESVEVYRENAALRAKLEQAEAQAYSLRADHDFEYRACEVAQADNAALEAKLEQAREHMEAVGKELDRADATGVTGCGPAWKLVRAALAALSEEAAK